MRTAGATGANRGIGEAIAGELAARGLRGVVVDEREARQGFVTLGDVTRADQVAALAKPARARAASTSSSTTRACRRRL